LGAIFVYLTRAIAWRKSLSVFLSILRDYKSTSGNRGTSYKKAMHLYLARRAAALAGKKTPPGFFERNQDGPSIPSDRIISHKKAFLTVVATTVGIGNIAGVGTAIHLGGPGALFWMWVSALFGMFFRMASTYMAIKLRPADGNSLSFATPMVYLKKYMTGRWSFITPLVTGLILVQGVVLYNLVQANSVAHAVNSRFGVPNLVIAILMTLCVGTVILGGLNKIVNYCSSIAPVAIVIYVITGLLVLLAHPLPAINALGQVFSCAFLPYSIAGGVAGYTVLQAMQFGVSRGVFSHMSGMGTSAFLQAANKEAPAKGAFMSAMTPFVDTVIICSITGLVILSVPNWKYQTGAYLTAESFEAGLGFLGQIVVVVCLVIFALTTIFAFAHITERCFEYLGGTNLFCYRIVFLIVIFLGPFLDLRFVWSLSDIIIAAIITCHLIPLLFITLKNRKKMCSDLQDLTFKAKDQRY
jgi:AGCS family alanine or glycine:cation symporter